MAQCLPPKSMVFSWSSAFLISIFFKGPKTLGISWLYGSSFIFFLNFSFQNFFIIFYFLFLKTFPFFFLKISLLKTLFTKDFFFFSGKLFFFAKKLPSFKFFFFFFLSSPLARIYCSFPLKVHKILIILGLGMQ